MTLAKEADREKDSPRSREAIYLLLDLVRNLYVCLCVMNVNIEPMPSLA